MNYTLLIYAAEQDFAAKSNEEGRVYSDYMAYTIGHHSSGATVARLHT